MEDLATYWEERAVKAEQHLLSTKDQAKRLLEQLHARFTQSESRANILQAELEKAKTQAPAPSRPAEDWEEKLKSAEERARLFELEIRQVHYKIADRLSQEPAELWFQGFPVPFEPELSNARSQELLDQCYRSLGYAEAMRQRAQVLLEKNRLLSQPRELPKEAKPAPSEPDLEVQKLAFQDSVTELPNLALLSRFLQQELRKAALGEVTLALVALDLDRLRSVNLSLGAEIGDALLQSLSQRLKARLKPEEVLARGRDDEFLVIFSLPVHGGDGLQATTQAAAGLASRLLAELADPIAAGTHQLMLSGGCGVVVSQGHEDERLVLERCQLATRRAKREGRNRALVFDPSFEDAGKRRVKLAGELNRALVEEQFSLQFQPIVEVATGRIWGTEALLRWNHPTLGVVEPSQFIDIALESGLIVPLGEWVVREATQLASQLETLYLSINISAQELMQANFARRFTKLLELSHVTRPDRLILEIGEKELGLESERIAPALKELRRWNVQLAVDDFTFDSVSLAVVQKLDIGHVKIDSLLVHNLHDPLCDGLVRAAVQLAATLKCKVWAERVETQEQFLRLKELGVELVQGNFLCPPLPPGGLRERLKAQR